MNGMQKVLVVSVRSGKKLYLVLVADVVEAVQTSHATALHGRLELARRVVLLARLLPRLLLRLGLLELALQRLLVSKYPTTKLVHQSEL